MASISSRNLVDAVLRVERMSFQERERLAEAIHDQQPQLFFSVLVLPRYGATLAQTEVVLNLLRVFFEAMKCSGEVWPVITEEVQERCLTRISGRVRFIEGLPRSCKRRPPWMLLAIALSGSCWPTLSENSKKTTCWTSKPKLKKCSCWRR